MPWAWNPRSSSQHAGGRNPDKGTSPPYSSWSLSMHSLPSACLGMTPSLPYGLGLPDRGFPDLGTSLATSLGPWADTRGLGTLEARFLPSAALALPVGVCSTLQVRKEQRRHDSEVSVDSQATGGGSLFVLPPALWQIALEESRDHPSGRRDRANPLGVGHEAGQHRQSGRCHHFHRSPVERD